ncbi:MAG: NAD(P)-dependent oxidoreductase, partial [Armatimonadetes bacterium]|nr:NAD(P)-dependent oxidoreductase [Armatimonadota bacterium]
DRDLSQLLHRCIDAPDDLRFEIVHGVSDNQFKRLDITSTRKTLGYQPQDNSFELSSRVDLDRRRPDEDDV